MNRWEGSCTVCSRPWKYPGCLFPRSESEIAKTMAQAEVSMEKRKRPFALVMQKGSVAPHALSGRLESRVDQNRFATKTSRRTRMNDSRGRWQSSSFSTLSPATKRSSLRQARPVANSSQSRTAPNHLYVVGGMGTASAIGFGVAHALPQATSRRDRRRWRCPDEAGRRSPRLAFINRRISFTSSSTTKRTIQPEASKRRRGLSASRPSPPRLITARLLQRIARRRFARPFVCYVIDPDLPYCT